MNFDVRKIIAILCAIPIALISYSLLLVVLRTGHPKYLESDFQKNYVWNGVEVGTLMRLPINLPLAFGRHYAVIAFTNGQITNARILFRESSGEVPPRPQFVSGTGEKVTYHTQSGDVTLDISRWMNYPAKPPPINPRDFKGDVWTPPWLTRSNNVELAKRRNIRGSQSLAQAVADDRLDLVRAWLDNGGGVDASLDTNGTTPLMLACRQNRTNIVNLLLENGASGNARNAEGNTALHLAAYDGYDEMARLLLAKGAALGATNRQGVTALHYAAMAGRAATATVLIDNGAPLEAKSNGGETALTLAAQNHHLEMVRLLLDKGAQIETANATGVTPLMQAALVGDADIVKYLLGRGAAINARSLHGGTALDAAKDRGQTQVAQILQESGGKE